MLAALFALMVALMLGGDRATRFEEVKTKIEDHIQDEVRREAILDTHDQLDQDLDAAEEIFASHFEELILVHYAYRSTEAEFDTVTAKLKEDQRQFNAELLTKIAELELKYDENVEEPEL